MVDELRNAIVFDEYAIRALAEAVQLVAVSSDKDTRRAVSHKLAIVQRALAQGIVKNIKED